MDRAPASPPASPPSAEARPEDRSTPVSSLHHLPLDAQRVAGILQLKELAFGHAEGLMQDQHQPAVEGVEGHAVAAVVAHQHIALPPRTTELQSLRHLVCRL